jgi:hypothetical protein
MGLFNEARIARSAQAGGRRDDLQGAHRDAGLQGLRGDFGGCAAMGAAGHSAE